MSDLTRSLALAEAQERALKTNISNAEATIRGLKEQIQRMRTTIQQVRAQCANDIRKRDLEMQKLRSHLADRQRGKREGLGVTTININPAVDRGSRAKALSGGEGVNDPGYSLRQETTEFLTELCQNLSDENDTLITLARNTVQTLRDLQGLPDDDEEEEHSSRSTSTASHGPVTTLPASYEQLSAQMDTVLGHLRMLLTNPSFVSLEEVELRDEEIKRLRDGWEKMENRWKQAVTMMDRWHQRISEGGDSVQMDELQMGMNLDLSIDSVKRPEVVDEETTSKTASIFDEEQTEETESDCREQVQKHPSPTESQPRKKERKASIVPNRALRERSENVRSTKSPRKVSFTPGLRGSPCNPSGEGDETLLVKAHRSDAVTQRPSRKRLDTKVSHHVSKDAAVC